MVDKIYSNRGIEIGYDTVEDLVYISIDDWDDYAVCTQDYTKQELVDVLKDMIKVLEG